MQPDQAKHFVWKEWWLKDGLNGGAFQTRTGVAERKGPVGRRLIMSYFKESSKLLSCTLMIQGLQLQNWLKEFLVVSIHWTCTVALFTYFSLSQFSGLAYTTSWLIPSAQLKGWGPRMQHSSHQKCCWGFCITPPQAEELLRRHCHTTRFFHHSHFKTFLPLPLPQ